MKMDEYSIADREVEQVVNANHARFRAAQQQGVCYGAETAWEEAGGRMRRRVQLRRVVNTAARLLPGLVCLAAIPKGWMYAPLACLMFLASLVWAMGYYARGYRYG